VEGGGARGMSVGLEESYAWCRGVARARARNFYYSFLLLDGERRKAMCAIYAFMRICDDLSDEPGEKSREVFQAWRRDMEAALDGGAPGHAVWPAFADTVARYRIPREYFHAMIDGVESDIDFQRVETFGELYQYCYRVASVVGLTVVHVLGFISPQALPLAEKCGVAFQLTNILRDVREDYEAGRVYLPAEDLAQFGVRDGEFAGPELTAGVRRLLEFEARRARAYYDESAALVGMVREEGRPMLAALIETYRRLLERIEDSGYDVLRRRISLPVYRKLWFLAKARWSVR
jgi:phytoene synthase